MIEYDQMILRKNTRIGFKIVFLAVLAGFIVFLLVVNTKKFSVSHTVTTLKSATQVVVVDKGVNSATTLANYLRTQGIELKINDVVITPNFGAPGLSTTANGGSLIIYDYYSSDKARADVNSIVKNFAALTGLNQMPIHYFKKNPLLVKYIGDDEDVLTSLEKILGPQFAGE